jgi:hypothetical protein
MWAIAASCVTWASSRRARPSHPPSPPARSAPPATPPLPRAPRAATVSEERERRHKHRPPALPLLRSENTTRHRDAGPCRCASCCVAPPPDRALTGCAGGYGGGPDRRCTLCPAGTAGTDLALSQGCVSCAGRKEYTEAQGALKCMRCPGSLVADPTHTTCGTCCARACCPSSADVVCLHSFRDGLSCSRKQTVGLWVEYVCVHAVDPVARLGKGAASSHDLLVGDQSSVEAVLR